MFPDLVAWVSKMFAGLSIEKIRLAWPIVLHIVSDVEELAALFNDGKAPMFAGPPGTPRGIALVNAITESGVCEQAEAERVVNILELGSCFPGERFENGAVPTGAGNAIPQSYTEMMQRQEAHARVQPRRFQ